MEGRSIQGSDGVGSLKLQQPRDRVFFIATQETVSIGWIQTRSVFLEP